MNGNIEYNGAELFPKFKPRVITRARGDIPGCVPAVDVFVEREVSQVRAYNDCRVAVYAKSIRKDGPWPSTLEPFRNRATATKLNYYNT